MSAGYDAIVVGARCAGAPTAMPLARQGYRVLLVERQLSERHVVHASPATARLPR
jgi:choline dehydrogenase-like flavoprotein